ncbi:uncharacterized protein MAM_07006 [Metarhizium album ARSEF 1941]|uniref:WHIM1 domain-containing protein n=1 Tax=Metarhizium album (strain ARSEF 1941) TaxID=1081103 RepID=A0A0B2WGJ0_METAS|nr:uncharacterized protein MAM_07006 [Metarhizium album ARSEF 1941]KHN95121.1 hypothetical protein MAM_07006 [Metarhizium album ARSEF 1941]
MTADDDLSDLSSLSSLSPVPSDVELDGNSDDATAKSKSGILKFFPKLSEQPPKEPSPPPRKRSPSPPHEYVLADNPDIAFIVMFRSRFSDAFSKSLAHFGPQELERDVVEPIPGDRVEHFLCAILGLLLNRKQDVKLGHYGRALEDAITSHKNQWPASWKDKNPLSGGATFNSMTPTERLTLLRTLILWAMASSDTVKGLINQAYKQNRQEDDLNQPRSVQPWGSDGDKRRYFLIEGQDDTNFRIYREGNPAATNRTWFSVAGSIQELKALAEKLETRDGGPKAKKLSQKMLQVVPRFEAGEEKRKRREYRQMRKEQFKRPEPGFSMYEGRTRGKRIKYTYSDDEDGFFSDSTGYKRSSRNTGANTPAETGPVTTSSGRQIRAPPRLNMVADDSAPGSTRGENSELEHDDSIAASGRPSGPAAYQDTNGWSKHNSGGDGSDEESEAEFGDDEEDAHVPEESESEDDFDDEEAMVEDDLDDQRQSLVVKLSVTPPNLRTVLSPIDEGPNMLPTPDTQDWKVDATVQETRTVEMQDAPAPEAHSIPLDQIMTEQTQTSSADIAEKMDAIRVPTISAISSTPLAFRGSPEKTHAQLASPSGDFNDTN